MNIPLLVISAVLILILLFLMSSKRYIFRSHVRTLVEAPLGHAFSVTMDESLMSEWMSTQELQFIRMEKLQGADRAPGSQWKLVFRSKRGKLMEMEQTVTDYIENKHFGFDLNDPYFHFHIDILFDEEEGQTIITENLAGNSQRSLLNAMMRIFGRQSVKMKKKMYERLKQIIEETYHQSV